MGEPSHQCGDFGGCGVAWGKVCFGWYALIVLSLALGYGGLSPPPLCLCNSGLGLLEVGCQVALPSFRGVRPFWPPDEMVGGWVGCLCLGLLVVAWGFLPFLAFADIDD